MDHYNTIERSSIAEFKDRGSRFIGHACPIQDTGAFKKILQQLKKDHPKAVHHCFAYRLGLTKDIFRVSDDGEPAGTAGKPILGQIDHKQLTNIAIIVVRYFGGTLLGVPGLINAYKTVSSLALQIVPVIQKQVEISYILHFEHAEINDIMTIIKNSGCIITEQELQLFPYLKVNIPKIKQEEVLLKLKELRNVRIENLV